MVEALIREYQPERQTRVSTKPTEAVSEASSMAQSTARSPLQHSSQPIRSPSHRTQANDTTVCRQPKVGGQAKAALVLTTPSEETISKREALCMKFLIKVIEFMKTTIPRGLKEVKAATHNLKAMEAMHEISVARATADGDCESLEILPEQDYILTHVPGTGCPSTEIMMIFTVELQGTRGAGILVSSIGTNAKPSK